MGVIVGPVLAMFLSHVFSGAMAKHVEAGRILTGQEWRRVAASENPFLLLCVPPLVIVTVLFALGVSLTGSIQIIVRFGTAPSATGATWPDDGRGSSVGVWSWWSFLDS